MRKLVAWLMLLSVLGWSGSWNNDMETARFFAKKRHQMLMVFVESKRCKWCRKMKTRTFADPGIQATYHTITRLKVNEDNRYILAQLPRVNAVPVVFFLDPKDKQILIKVSGYRDAKQFLNMIKNAQKKFDLKYKKVK